MKTRIFIGYINTVSVGTLLQNGFNSLHAKADFYTNEKRRSGYDYYGNENYIKLHFSRNRYLYYLQICLFLFKILFKYKYFIFIQGGALLRNYYDIRFLKLFRRKISVLYVGCDIRMPEAVAKFKWNPCSKCGEDYQLLVNCNIDTKKNNLALIEKYSDYIFSPDECAGFIGSKYYSHNFPVDFNFIDKYLDNEHGGAAGSFKIIHAPSSYHIKGTVFIEKAVAAVKEKYPFIIYKRLQGLSKAEVISELVNADLVIDQMLVGYYGVFAVEAMALKKPVICYMREDIWKNIGSDCPVINANPDNLEEVLENQINNRNNFKVIGGKYREYALKNHSAAAAAEKMLGVFRENR